MPHTITKEFHFSAAHRLIGHPKCGRLHGHNYVVTVELEALRLVGGMVLDYGELDVIKRYIDDRLDHRYLVSKECIDADDVYYYAALRSADVNDRINRSHDVSELPIGRSTAEELAEFLYGEFHAMFSAVSGVEVQETPSTSAIFRPYS